MLAGIKNLFNRKTEEREAGESSMDSFLLQAVFFLILLSSGSCNGKCTSGTFDATTSLSFVTNEHHGSDEDCVISIRPSALHTSGFYLEIKWLVFEVEGEMLECENNFVEVTLTR